VRELLRELLWHRAFDNDEVLVLHGRSLGRAAPGGRVRTTQASHLMPRLEWRPTLKAAGVDDLHFHDLRHFAASALRDAGMDNKMRSVVIGHADERITDGVYTQISEDQVQRAAKQFDPLAASGL